MMYSARDSAALHTENYKDRQEMSLDSRVFLSLCKDEARGKSPVTHGPPRPFKIQEIGSTVGIIISCLFFLHNQHDVDNIFEDGPGVHRPCGQRYL